MRIFSFSLVSWLGPASPFLFVWIFNTVDAAMLSWCAARQSRDRDAVALLGAAAAIRLKIGSPARQEERGRIDQTLASARTRLSPDEYATAWNTGA